MDVFLRQRQRVGFWERLSPRLGQERHGEQTNAVEQADNCGRFPVAAESDNERTGEQRAIAEISRGVLKIKPAAVARMRVGNSSGSHIAVHENTPWTKNP